MQSGCWPVSTHLARLQLVKLLHKNKLVSHQSKPYDGYRLASKGYDYLGLKSLAKRGTLTSLGIQVPTALGPKTGSKRLPVSPRSCPQGFLISSYAPLLTDRRGQGVRHIHSLQRGS